MGREWGVGNCTQELGAWGGAGEFWEQNEPCSSGHREKDEGQKMPPFQKAAVVLCVGRAGWSRERQVERGFVLTAAQRPGQGLGSEEDGDGRERRGH